MDWSLLPWIVSAICLGLIIGWLAGQRKTPDGETLRLALREVSADALRANNESFLALARASFDQVFERSRDELARRHASVEDVVRPVRASLDRMQEIFNATEKERTGSYRALMEQVRSLQEAEADLRRETSRIAAGLTSSAIRGRWGEIQLKRVVELAGMVSWCDFDEQKVVTTDRRVLRPDMIVNLPEGRRIVVDAKTPLESYMEAASAKDDLHRREKLRDHGRAVKTHIKSLSSKNYGTNTDGAPDMVVMFLPGDHFLSGALEADPTLIEMAAERGVLLATPVTLIGVLQAVALGWRHEGVAQNVARILDVGAEFTTRLKDLVQHMDKVGRTLDGAVAAYNDAVGTLDARVLATARKLRELQVKESDDLLRSPRTVDRLARTCRSIDENERDRPEQPTCEP